MQRHAISTAVAGALLAVVMQGSACSGAKSETEMTDDGPTQADADAPGGDGDQGTESDDHPHALHLVMTNLLIDGEHYYVALSDTLTGTVRLGEGVATSGACQVDFTGALVAGRDYILDLYDNCGPACPDCWGAFASGARRLPVFRAAAEDRTITYDPASCPQCDFPAACNSFVAGPPYDLYLEGVDFDDYEGALARVALVDVETDEVISRRWLDLVGTGEPGSTRLVVNFPRLLRPDKDYRVVYYVQLGTTWCGADDYVWKIDVQAPFDRDRFVSFDSDQTQWLEGCAKYFPEPVARNVTLAGAGFAADNGSQVRGALRDPVLNDVAAYAEAVVAGGAFSLEFAATLLTGTAYEADYFIDVDGDGICESRDKAWRVSTPPITSDVSIDVSGSEAQDQDGCAGFGETLSVHGTGFAAENARTVRVAVTETSDALGTTKVVDIRDAAIAGGEFSLSFPGIITATFDTYGLDLFVDQDADDICDSPPSDHMWHIYLGYGVGQNVEVAYSTAFDAAACSSFAQ